MSQTKRKSNRTGSENGKDRQGDKRTRAPDGMSNVECGANYMSTDKRCEMEFEDTRSRKKRKCRNIAERILRCNHMVCGPCFELRNRCSASKQEVYFCPFCDYRTLNSQVKTIKSVHGDDQKGNCNTIFFLEQEKGNISKTSPSPSPNSDQCVIERCKSTAVVFILSCKHNFCSSCFCRFHKPLVILEDFCCIKCYVCKMEMWLRNDEMQEKAKATGERFSNIGMQHIGMADANVEIDQYFEMENFNIDWKFKGYYRPQFKITEWDDVNKPECSKTVVSHNKDGVYTYECNTSKGTFFFKLASYRHNKEDKYSIWIGPIERIKGNNEIEDPCNKEQQNRKN